MIPLVNIKRLQDMSSRRIADYLRRNADALVFIYSGEWKGYWGPERCGYTDRREEAGVYTLADALDASHHCDPSKQIYYEFLPPDYIA